MRPPTTVSMEHPRAEPGQVREPAPFSTDLHWYSKASVSTKAWRVTFLGHRGDVPQLAVGPDVSVDALNVHVQVDTLRQGAKAPAPKTYGHEADDSMLPQDDNSQSGGAPSGSYQGEELLDEGARRRDRRRRRRLAGDGDVDGSGSASNSTGGGGAGGSGQAAEATGYAPPGFSRVGTTAPIWVMLFGPGEAPRSDVNLTEAKKLAIWMRRIDKVASVVTMRVPSLTASHLRIVRAGEAGKGSPLCLAEVEMYEEVHSPMYEYSGSSPLPQNVAASPLSPLEPLSAGFQDTWPSGKWLLAITDRHKTLPVLANNGGPTLEPEQGTLPPAIETGKQGGLGGLAASAAIKHGRGGVSRWELRLTDVLGQTNTYYMDSQVQRLGHLR